MLSTGIRAQVGVKILGDDLETLQRVAFDVERIVREVRGAIGVAPSRVQAKPYLEIVPDRFRIAQYGLSMRDVLDYVETGIGGLNLGTTIHDRERIPLQLRFQSSDRNDIERLGDLPITVKSGVSVPLGQLAEINARSARARSPAKTDASASLSKRM
jgi:Cu(I)/Ag(I) efflux system membrane protein CusA/SilA